MSLLDQQLVVDEADGCAVAIERASSGSYDLVLLDLKMPGVGGLQALGAVRESCPSTPVIVLSGEDTPQVVRGAIESGAMGFIPKSAFGMDELEEVWASIQGGEAPT